MTYFTLITVVFVQIVQKKTFIDFPIQFTSNDNNNKKGISKKIPGYRRLTKGINTLIIFKL